MRIDASEASGPTSCDDRSLVAASSLEAFPTASQSNSRSAQMDGIRARGAYSRNAHRAVDNCTRLAVVVTCSATTP